MAKKRGKFITLEGIEGCGKSTQIKTIADYLKKQRQPFVILREPGGTVISEKIRRILLDKKNRHMVPETELLLYCAARAQITKELILPHLKKRTNVLCDRFYDSTLAYQGYALSMNMPFVEKLCQYASASLKPDRTFLLDLPVKVGLSRSGVTDRMEARSLRYHEKVRKGFLMLAKKEPKRFRIINAKQSKKDVQAAIEYHLDRIRF